MGVNPPGFTGVGSVQASPDAFLPLAMQPLVYSLSVQPTSELNDSDLWWLNVMGRLKPGTRDVQESAALDVTLAAAVRNTMTVGSDETLPHLILINGSRGVHQMTGIKKPVAVLLVLVAVVLLLACANIATLLLARATRRKREMSVRMALGAGRWRILSQLLTENLLLGSLGGLGGLLIGYMARNVVPALLWQRNTRGIHFDWGVFAYAALITILTALLFCLAPAWTATHTETAGSLQESSHLYSPPSSLGREGYRHFSDCTIHFAGRCCWTFSAYGMRAQFCRSWFSLRPRVAVRDQSPCTTVSAGEGSASSFLVRSWKQLSQACRECNPRTFMSVPYSRRLHINDIL